MLIVLDCPGCGKRFEVDAALAGKKSRCKACGEVFSIPAPWGRAAEPPRASAGSALPAPPPIWESVLEDAPASFKASRGPFVPADDEFDLPPPPRAAYPTPSQKTSGSYRHRESNPEVGFTVAGGYLALALLVVIGFLIWQAAAQPPRARVGQIFAITVLFLHGTALLLSFAGSIWILVLAFGESLAQGLLCLLVPCYVLFYMMSRWEETKGAFALELLPVANIVAFFAIGIFINVTGQDNAGNDVADAGAQPDAVPAQGGPPAGLMPPPGFGSPPGFAPPPGFGPRPEFGPRPGLGPRRGQEAPRPANSPFPPPPADLNAFAQEALVQSKSEIPADADAVTRSLIQLRSLETPTKKDGLNRLMRTAPDDRLAEVVQAVVLLLDDDGWLVGDAIKVLTIWKSPDAVPALIKLTNDNRFTVRHEVIKALGKLKNPRGVEPVILRIKEDGFQVEAALKEMGPVAEPALIERLTNPDSDIRRQVCAILKVIGGKETLRAMQSLPRDPELSVQMAARDAMSAIGLRVGPLTAAERKNAGGGATIRRGKQP